jgi:hypothetical protein
LKIFALNEKNLEEVAELTGRTYGDLVRTLQTSRLENKIVYIMYAEPDFWTQVRKTPGKVLPFPGTGG